MPVLKQSRTGHAILSSGSVKQSTRSRIKYEAQNWRCISLSYPLINVLKAFALFDFIRGLLDTIDILGVLITLLGIDYEMIHLPPTGFLANSATYNVARTFFFHNRNTLIVILGIGVVVFVAEVPLAVILYRAAIKYDKRNCGIWIQASGILLFFNIIIFGAIGTYSEKAGVIRDDIASQSHATKLIIYGCLLRAALFDFMKAAEMIFVAGYLRELKKRARIRSIE